MLRPASNILELPKGFSVKVIATKGTPMDEGFLKPGKADGMAAFAGPKCKMILVQNHEVSLGASEEGPFGADNSLLSKINKHKLYDSGKGLKPGVGGIITMVYNEEIQQVESRYLSLVGTIRNCAGRTTPWNTWISCEETVDRGGLS